MYFVSRYVILQIYKSPEVTLVYGKSVVFTADVKTYLLIESQKNNFNEYYLVFAYKIYYLPNTMDHNPTKVVVLQKQLIELFLLYCINYKGKYAIQSYSYITCIVSYTEVTWYNFILILNLKYHNEEELCRPTKKL